MRNDNVYWYDNHKFIGIQRLRSCIRLHAVRRPDPSVNIVRLMRILIQPIQASALLTCVGEQCLTAAPTKTVQFPRYHSIAIPTRRSPELTSSLSVDRAGPHRTHRKT
jgi:hypothetical protein